MELLSVRLFCCKMDDIVDPDDDTPCNFIKCPIGRDVDIDGDFVDNQSRGHSTPNGSCGGVESGRSHA